MKRPPHSRLGSGLTYLPDSKPRTRNTMDKPSARQIRLQADELTKLKAKAEKRREERLRAIEEAIKTMRDLFDERLDLLEKEWIEHKAGEGAQGPPRGTKGRDAASMGVGGALVVGIVKLIEFLTK